MMCEILQSQGDENVYSVKHINRQLEKNMENICSLLKFWDVKMFIIIIIYLLKSTVQEDAHMINARTRAGHESTENWRLHFAH